MVRITAAPRFEQSNRSPRVADLRPAPHATRRYRCGHLIDKALNRGYVLLPLRGTSPPPGGAGLLEALARASSLGPLPTAVEAGTIMAYEQSAIHLPNCGGTGSDVFAGTSATKKRRRARLTALTRSTPRPDLVCGQRCSEHSRALARGWNIRAGTAVGCGPRGAGGTSWLCSPERLAGDVAGAFGMTWLTLLGGRSDG